MSQNSALQKEILAELDWEPSITASHIGVAANDGIVTLTGHVESFAEKYAAEKAVLRVKGVKGVAEEIEVRLPFDRKRGDDDIALAALNRLDWDSFVPANTIKVKVENGILTLSGEVECSYQKDAAEQAVRRLMGVVGVSNQISITPAANAENISEDIMDALHRSWFFDPKTVCVTAHGGDVRLTGTVHSLHERRIASATAWASPGATHVENDILIN